MAAPRFKPAIALSEAEERDAYPHPGRRLSRYEVVSREKPLPHVPVPVKGPSPRELRRKADMRIPSQRGGQSTSQLQQQQQQTSANLAAASPSQNPRVVQGTPRETASMHTLKTATSQPMRTVNKAASFSMSPAPRPGASSRRSSKKINQLVGHDLDVPVDPYGLQHKNNFSYSVEYFEGSSSSSYGSGSGSGSDSDDILDGYSCFNMEEGLLPLLEEDEEVLSSRETSWVPRTPMTGIMPPPLNIRRHGSEPSVGSTSSAEHSPTHPKASNFTLSSGSPMRWDPAYGQFTDRRAANDYHRFAAELATPSGREKAAEPASPPKRFIILPASSKSSQNLNSNSTGKLRQTGTAAIYRLWENVRDDPEPVETTTPPPPPPPPPLPLSLPPLPSPPAATAELASVPCPAMPSRRNTLKKQRPSRLSACDAHPRPTKPVQRSLHVRSKSTSQVCTQPPPPLPANQCSVFDFDSDDEGGRGHGRRWWRRSDEEDSRSSSEWPSVQWNKKQDDDKEKSSSFGGGVKGLLANARDRALLSPAERRRLDLRKSIKVLRAPEDEKDARKAVKK
ncbi:hypothetical protein NLG97_g7055 [Lecanicillium saksenae]|uniref:Uncharacterized protein n=1 Tax=Lecanicillium saksenae TaxID=468837 RepID=A0ACC1QQX5_9HYPO|nr:hypothetical protein NLG97_g7055 [Lecanicillium saksenae]